MPKELNLNGRPKEVLQVTIGEDVYTIPLANTLPFKKAKALLKLAKKGEQDYEQMLDVFFDFFKEYIPEEVLENLSMDEIGTLASAWGGTSTEESDKTLGESSAS